MPQLWMSTLTLLFWPKCVETTTMIMMALYHTGSTNHVRQRQRLRSLLFALLMVLTIAILLALFGSEYNTTMTNMVPVSIDRATTTTRQRSTSVLAPQPTESSSSTRSTFPKKKHKAMPAAVGHRKRIDAMRKALTLARGAFEERLQADYGADSYHALFSMGYNDGSSNTDITSPHAEQSSMGRHLFGPFDTTLTSFNRSKFVVVAKLVQTILQGTFTTMPNATTTSMLPLVWATGGNSIAAGHGNLYDESYTQVLARAVAPALEMVGLDWQSRLYASSAAQSAPEAAFCSEAIYGTDVDILVWDFGLTDGRRTNEAWSKLEWYFMRAAANANRRHRQILLLALNVYDDVGRLRVLRRLEEKGLAVLYSRQSVLDHVINNIPDTVSVSMDELDHMPRLVRKFKCNNRLEVHDQPNCLEDDKFNPICPKRLYQTSWHPGWKWHALMGNLLALFVFDLMDDALREVAVIAKERRLDDVQSQLEAEQRMRGWQLLQSNIDESLMAIIPDPSQRDTIDWKMLLYAPIYCHLSVLPSETRRKGIVTNDTSCVLDLFSVKDSEAVSRDMLAKEASVYTQSNECDTMRLVYEASDKDPRRLDCDQQLHIDFKEYFYVSHEDGWRHVIVPNQAEHAEYGKSTSDDMAATEMKPIRSPAAIAVCLVWCSWNKCPPGHVDLAALESGNATIEINEQKVTTWTRFHSNGPECVLMGHSNGRYWTPNHSGRFVIRARVDATPQAFLRATSFIVWDNESYHDSNR